MGVPEQPAKIKIEDLIRSPDSRQRIRAIALLLKSGNVGALPYLERFSEKDLDSEVRFYARRAVAEFKKAKGMESQPEMESPVSATPPATSPKDRVRAALISDNPTTIQRALKAIATVKDATFAPELLKLLAESAVAEVRANVVTVLGILATPEAIRGIEQALRDSDHRVVANCVEQIGRLKPKDDLALLIPFLQDGDGRVQAVACKALMAAWPTDALAALRAMMQSENLAYRASAAFACSTIAHEAVVPLLEQAIRDRDPGVRAQGFKGLRRLVEKGIQQAVVVLSQLDPSGEQQQKHHTGAIAPLIEVGLTIVREGLASPDPKIRLQTTFTAAQDENRAALPLVITALKTETDPRVRATMVSAIGVLGQSSEVVPILSPLLKDSDARIRANAIEGLGKHTHIPSVAAAIAPLVGDENRRCQGNAIIALWRELGQTAYDHVAELAASPDPLTRKTALFCLDELAGDEGIPPLLLLAGDTDASIRRRALEVLDHLAANGSKKAVLARIEAREKAAKAASWKDAAAQAAHVGGRMAAQAGGVLKGAAERALAARDTASAAEAPAAPVEPRTAQQSGTKRARSVTSVLTGVVVRIAAYFAFRLFTGRSKSRWALRFAVVAFVTFKLFTPNVRSHMVASSPGSVPPPSSITVPHSSNSDMPTNQAGTSSPPTRRTPTLDHSRSLGHEGEGTSKIEFVNVGNNNIKTAFSAALMETAAYKSSTRIQIRYDESTKWLVHFRISNALTATIATGPEVNDKQYPCFSFAVEAALGTTAEQVLLQLIRAINSETLKAAGLHWKADDEMILSFGESQGVTLSRSLVTHMQQEFDSSGFGISVAILTFSHTVLLEDSGGNRGLLTLHLVNGGLGGAFFPKWKDPVSGNQLIGSLLYTYLNVPLVPMDVAW